MSAHRYPDKLPPADRLRYLARRRASLEERLTHHFDGCRTCREGAWADGLCPDGARVARDIRHVQYEIEEFGEL